MGWGYIRVSIDYAHDDTFDRDLRIDRVANPFSVYGDPHSTAADSADWNCAFVTEMMTKDAFEAKYGDAAKVGWDDYADLEQPWMQDGEVLIAEYWKREEVPKKLLRLASGEILSEDVYAAQRDLYEALGIPVVATRDSRGFRVTQRIMTGAEVLEENKWAGKYIPIISVYGDDIHVKNKRHLRSLIRDAKDAQRMFNYWRTTSTELVALSPKAPFIGPKGAFDSDPNWETANSENHPFLEFDGQMMPQRQPFAGIPAGALQEALNASDDMKAIMGIYDPSLGARSNETSGRAILARQRESDTGTFHFVDNLSRAIRHTGRVLLDLIPLVYNEARIIRVLGPKGEAQPVPVNQPAQIVAGPDGQERAQPMAPPPGVDVEPPFNLTTGKYDVAVEAGPSFTTRREETVAALTEMIRAYPPAAMAVGDLLVQAMDFPDSDEVAQRLKQAAAQAQGGDKGVDPAEVQKLVQENAKLQMQVQALQGDRTIEAERVKIDAYQAETDRMKTVHEMTKPQPLPRAN